MNLSDIAKQMIKEDTWGNNPSAAGSMSPGRSPTANPPPASSNVKFYDVKKDYTNFTSEIERQEEVVKKKFSDTLGKQFGNKKVTVRASKGSVGQVEKDYGITVATVNVVYLKDKFYVVFNGTDKAEYFVNTDFKVKVDAAAPEAPTMASGKVGNIVHPQVMGVSKPGTA